jgi:hypothetical protein
VNRHQLEQRLWLALRDLGADRHTHARNVVDNLLDAADMYAVTREVAYHNALAAADTPGVIAGRRADMAGAFKKPRST